MPAVSIRVAAAGDIHCSLETCEHIGEAFARHDHEADLFLLAGDLTTHGEPEEAQVLVDVVRAIETPIAAVLGNHDHHAGKGAEVAAILRGGGITLLERSHASFDVDGHRVAIVGTKGFVGGFPGSALPDFGEPLLRRVYAETSDEVDAIDTGLRAVADADLRILLLHYSPSMETLVGEPEGIWTFLGSHRLGGPIVEHRPDLVLHGHAHSGTFAGHVGGIPVFNVAVQVMNRDFWMFELEPHAREEVDRAEVRLDEQTGLAAEPSL